MSDPSLLNIPYRFKASKLYSQIPDSGLGDFVVSRSASNAATRVNAQGFIETVADNVPRLDYPLGGIANGCPALLVEPSAQNIMAQSETLSVSGNWARTNVLVSGGAIASPDGLTSGTLIVATLGSNTHWIERNAATTVTSGAVVTTSCFFKAHGTNTFAQLVIGNIGFSPASPFANFNLTGSGSVTAGNYTSAFIQNYGNGWYRCGFTTTAAANGTPAITICPILASGTGRATTFTGDGVNGVYAWGAQLETGSVATSYIPTTTAPITRGADLVSKTGVSSLIGQTEGAIYWEGSFGQIDKIFFSIGASTTQTIRLETTSNGFIQFGVISVTPQCGIATSGAINVGQFYKVAVAYKENDFVFYLNGTQVGTDSLGTIPTALAQIQFSSSATANISSQRCRALALYPTRLTNAQLQALTT